MKQGAIFYAVSVMVSLAAYYLNPLREFYRVPVTDALVFAAIGGGVILVGLSVGYVLDRRTPLSVYGGLRPLVSPRVAGVILILVGLEFGVNRGLALVFSSSLLLEGAYYVLLFAGGIALARWCCAKAHVAPLVAVLVLAVFASVAFIEFVTSSAAHFRFGPERWLFALQHLSGQAGMLPLDIAVVTTGWYLFSRKQSPAT